VALIDKFEKLLAAGKDSPLLRFSLGGEYLKLHDPKKAVEHLQAAVGQDEDYSAAWKLLGNALAECARQREAIAAYSSGIRAAQKRGDKQAAKEMTVFRRRLEKALGVGDETTDRNGEA
jgi:predicted Zn-dependent protease